MSSGAVSPADVVAATGASKSNVSRWFAAWREDELGRRRRAGFSRSAEVEAVLAPTPEAFAEFRSRYFEDEWGVPYVTMGYHLAWIAALLTALLTGGRLMILSPPRHGKTQLLIHFCVWLIIRNPNIRLIWIGLNEDNAQEAVGAVRDILENHEKLRVEVLGPDRSWRPAAKTGKSWTDGKFTVATREGVGIKSPTMRAVGKRGKLLSKDADMAVLDDIQDREAYESPASREQDVRWVNTQVSSRKEAHTALLVIGSRQHHEDLYGKLETNPGWQHIIESAHSETCKIPVHVPHGEHTYECEDCAKHVDCLLWPVKRTMAYLQDQRGAMDDDLMFEMVYLNKTRPAGDRYVTQAEIDACKNPTRSVGHWINRAEGTKQVVKPPGQLVAGLDPAYKGMQAAFLWSYEAGARRRWAMDVDNRPAGSTAGAREIIKDWFELYGCQLWIIEDNGFQGAMRQDPDLMRYCAEKGISVRGHFTDRMNKWDPNFGVPKQLEAFGLGQIDIPWGDEDTRSRFREAIKQWVNWDPDNKAQKSDIVMAAWFPERTFRSMRREHIDVEVAFDQTKYYDVGLGETYVGMAGVA